MIWEKIRSHAANVEMFRRSLRRGRMSHAYLFLGPDGVGKRRFGRAIAQCLLCERFEDDVLEACGECSGCRQVMAGTHPDLISVGCPPGKSEVPIEVFVGSHEKRGREGMCHDLSLRPASGRHKVAIIDDVDRLNEESANALLKTLEEPPSYATLMLIATNLDGILPTIRSRCQLMRFSPLSENDLSGLLQELQLVNSPEEADSVAQLSEGSLSLASQIVSPELRSLRESLYEGLAREQLDPHAIAAAMLAGLDDIGSETAVQRQVATWIVRFTIHFYRALARELAGCRSEGAISQVDAVAARRQPATTEVLETALACVDCAVTAERQLERNVSVPLCLEALFEEVARMHRRAVTQ